MEENRLRQIAGIDQEQKKLAQRAVQFLSMFGINVGVDSQQTRTLIDFVQSLPSYKGQNHPDQYQSQWDGQPKTFNTTRYIQSKDGYQYTY